jgi:hypothetical protein
VTTSSVAAQIRGRSERAGKSVLHDHSKKKVEYTLELASWKIILSVPHQRLVGFRGHDF